MPRSRKLLADTAESALLRKEWDFDRNSRLFPDLAFDTVTASSSVEVWWTCSRRPETCRHEHTWQARVSNRTSLGSGCPVCSGNQCCPCTSLAGVGKTIRLLWHKTKNREPTAEKCSRGSKQKVSSGQHSYQSKLAGRLAVVD